jgi:hypothetical protein
MPANIETAAGRPEGEVTLRIGIDIEMRKQEQELWCWAATASSLSAYFGGLTGSRAWSQCEIVNARRQCSRFQSLDPYRQK